MLNPDWFKLAICSREEKAQTVSLCKTLLALSEKSRREGIFSLQRDIERFNNTLTGLLLNLVISSIEPEWIRLYGEILIASSQLYGHELLDAMVSLEGILSIQRGDNPQMLCMMLSAFLGKDSDLLVYEDLNNELNTGSEYQKPTLSPTRNMDYESIFNDIATGLHLTNEQISTLNKPFSIQNTFVDLDPDIIAITLLYLEEGKQRELLESLPAEKMAETIRSICDLSEYDADIYIDIAKAFLENSSKALQSNYKPAGGMSVAASIIRACSSNVEEHVLCELTKIDSVLAGQLRDRLFVFDDLLKLDDRSIQKIIQAISPIDLALALKTAPKEILEKVLNNVSPQRALSIKDDINYMGVVRIKDVKDARQKLLHYCLHMEGTGEIRSPRHRDESTIDDFDTDADFS